MASDSDSEGEELSMLRPGLIHELRNVLNEYPDDGQILKEMIQNAEDAGAHLIKIIADKRQFSQDVAPGILKKHPHLLFLKGPALCVYNDATFSDADWKGIRMLHTSIKEKDPLKVGRFGLGFKSIFHLTDCLVIVSGEYIMYMNPFKGEDRYCTKKPLAKIKNLERDSILNCLDGVCSFSGSALVTGNYPGTLFWFPLRQKASDLSATVYSERNVEDLLNAFISEAKTMILFLKNIEQIDLYKRGADADQSPVLTFTVCIALSCQQSVCEQRKEFVNSLSMENGILPLQALCCTTEMTIETQLHSDLGSSTSSQQWLVVNYHPGLEEMSQDFRQLCCDSSLAYRPHIGVAFPTDTQENFQSQLFCFLPLPLDTRSPTGLPVHVNGYFALSQNRRHIKWPTADQLQHKAHLEPKLQWNCLLVREVLPRAYARLLYKLKELSLQDCNQFYKGWPDYNQVTDMWLPCLEPLYTELTTSKSFYSLLHDGSWISLDDAVLQSIPHSLSSELVEAVIKVYLLNNVSIVSLPDYIEHSLNKLKLLTAVRKTTPQHIRKLLTPECLSHLDSKQKLFLLEYLCSGNASHQFLADLDLLPLEDGRFGRFSSSAMKIYLCEDLSMVQLFPGLEDQLCSTKVSAVINGHLLSLAKSGIFSLRILQSCDIPTLIKRSMEVNYEMSEFYLDLDDKWIQAVWKYLAKSGLKSFQHLRLLPCIGGEKIQLLSLTGIYVLSSMSFQKSQKRKGACKQDKARQVLSSRPGFPPMTDEQVSCLQKLKVTVLPYLPNYILSHPQIMNEYVQYPNAEGILSALQQVSLNSDLRNKAVQTFNSSASVNEKNALIQLLLNVTNITHKDFISFIQDLKMFVEAQTDNPVSLLEVKVIAPDVLPTLKLPRRLLKCNFISKQMALKLGASEISQEILVQEILQRMQKSQLYTSGDKKKFMLFCFGNLHQIGFENLSLARRVEFVPTGSGEVKYPSDLYDPTNLLLLDLFHGEHKFPVAEFAESAVLVHLRKLGLRDQDNLQEQDIILVAQEIQKHQETEVGLKKAEALWKVVVQQGDQFSASTLQVLSEIRCFICLQDNFRPELYPINLPLKSTPKLVKPAEMCQYSSLPLAGSVMPVMRLEMSEYLKKNLHANSKLDPDTVLRHLACVIQNFSTMKASLYTIILKTIYKYLNKKKSCKSVIETLTNMQCVLVDADGHFAHPRQLWICKRTDDILDLSPYRFLMSAELADIQDLFLACGSHQTQDVNMLKGVLADIKNKHLDSSSDYEKDMRLVIQILNVLKRHSAACDGDVLLPIIDDDPKILNFKKARECTVGSGSVLSNIISSTDEEEDIFFVHPEVHRETALRLGALDVKSRSLTGMDTLDFSYEQQEDMTLRIHNLLKESYTDGFSVPKELIQNADDAGATEVKFMLDERQNANSRTNLISEGLASVQGPALWAFNDAVFTDTDFENIIKLGGETKRFDASKVGKFGLGFNSVYNLTDVPSFISRHTMALFDPQATYLERSAGLKLDFRKKINQALLTKLPQQFEPYQDIFGFTLHHQGLGVDYHGTLFRFPLRTPYQAEVSKLKNECYSENKCKEFLSMLMEKAGNLLMFTQNVQKLEIYHLPDQGVKPNQASCLLTVIKNSEKEIVVPHTFLSTSILSFVTEQWPKTLEIKIIENVKIEIDIKDTAKAICGINPCKSITQWNIAWSSGGRSSAQIAMKYQYEALKSLAAAAISVKDGVILPLSYCPEGFYKTGHLFCLLPLPEETVHVSFPLHINGTFALTSSRRGLFIQTEDDLGSSIETDWNSALFSEAVSQAYLLLLEYLGKSLTGRDNLSDYFALWPKLKKEPTTLGFYRLLVSTGSKVLPVKGQNAWISFAEAKFLDPSIIRSECGQIAWDVLLYFWDEQEHLVDLPSEISQQIEYFGQEEAFNAKVVTELEFFQSYFFPNICNIYWNITNRINRDRLTLHALLHNDGQILTLVKEAQCIPSTNHTVRFPHELIHPEKLPAKLYLPSEGRFPQTEADNNENFVSFCSPNSLQRLAELGMVTEDLPWKMVKERVESVQILYLQDKDSALNRCHHLLDYLASVRRYRFRFTECPDDVKIVLSQTKFLPILKKPENWPFPWAGNSEVLASPRQLYSENLKELVACEADILESVHLTDLRTKSGQKLEVLKGLGVCLQESFDNEKLFYLAMKQLISVSKTYHSDQDMNKVTQKICQKIYNYFNSCVKNAELKDKILETLADKEVAWTESGFVHPSRVAQNVAFDCRPYLFQLDKSLNCYKEFLQLIGIKENFVAEDAIAVLKQIANEHKERKLPEKLINLVSKVAQLLCEIIKTNLDQNITIFLPDRQGYMLPVSMLCMDDTDWIKESERMKFVHDTISSKIARQLGVKTKDKQFYQNVTHSIPFGQKERLANRIRRLLEGYTLDSSVFKELVQNADDAGATEIKFIKDFRSHGTKKIPTGWTDLQGPALCVYNNRSFSSRDIDAIQNLGVGSKSEDNLKIGQYGVGFNAVYHITDVPSFWTLTDNVEENVCVFDPCCRYVESASTEAPGTMFSNLDKVRAVYSDMMSGYLPAIIDMTEPGTLFRLPLRTEQMAVNSEIKREVITSAFVSNLLEEFEKEVKHCLLFLNNLSKIGIYTVEEDGSMKTDCEVVVAVDSKSIKQKEQFQNTLKQLSNVIQTSTTSLMNIPVSQVVCCQNITYSNGINEEWITVNRLGFSKINLVSIELQKEWSKEHFRLLPRGGVAVRLKGSKQMKNNDYLAFCMLPLPVSTGLPVHVNGHFALDHETRRNLWWNSVKDYKTEWNELIAQQVIVPAFSTAIQHMKDCLFQNVSSQNSAVLTVNLNEFCWMFPDPLKATSDFWKDFIISFYHQVVDQELNIFPVRHDNPLKLEWVSTGVQDTFTGCFSNLVEFFKNLLNQPRLPISVYSTQGHLPQNRNWTLSYDEIWPFKKAQLIETILKDINMKIVEMPHVLKYFRQSGIQSVHEVTPQFVISFLKSSIKQVHGGCNITDLPVRVERSSLKSDNHVEQLLLFIRHDPEWINKLTGLPLCLRQNQMLYCFEETYEESQPIVSEFYDLFPQSANNFLHEKIYRFFQHLPSGTEKMLKLLNIATSAQLLALELPKEYMIGKISSMMPGLLFEQWIKKLWSFISSELKKLADTDQVVYDRGPNDTLKCLSNCSLIPVKQNSGNRDELLLYPMKDAWHVVYMHAATEVSNTKLLQILKSLSLAFLNTALLPENNIATKLVASVNRPAALLQALTDIKNDFTLYPQDLLCVLNYFSDSLSSLIKYYSNTEQLRQTIRSLPFFVSHGGQCCAIHNAYTVLCIESTIPIGGLFEWSKAQIQSVVLLSKQFIPHALGEFLGISFLSDADFYVAHLLPTFHTIPKAYRTEHLIRVRDLMKSKSNPESTEKLIKQLKVTAFIEVDRVIYKACKFYSPYEPVFKAMKDQRSFPPEPFSKGEWKSFMEKAGMICEITPEMFISFAQTLERENCGITCTEELMQRSTILVGHLFFRPNLLAEGLLVRLRNIRFLRPCLVNDIETGKLLSTILAFFCQDHLVSFNECCSAEHSYLAWSSSCILHHTADPFHHMHFGEKWVNTVCMQLDFQRKASLRTVIQHVKNLCDALIGDGGRRIFLSSKQNQYFLCRIFSDLYKFLDVNNGCESELKELPIICDIKNKMMLKPVDVVEDLREDESINGFLMKAPVEFGTFFPFFHRLGMTEHVTVSHYARVLDRLHKEAKDNSLHVEEMKIVQKAVKGIFCCLKSDHEKGKLLTFPTLYLPTIDGYLLKSSEIVYIDNLSLSERIPNKPVGLKLFLGFDRLEIPLYILIPSVCELLPKEHQMKKISDLVKEVIPEEVKDSEFYGDYSKKLVEVLSDHHFIKAILQLVCAHFKTSGNQGFTEETYNKIIMNLSSIHSREVTHLITVLQWNNEYIPGSEVKKLSFAVMQKNYDLRTSTVYLDSGSCKNWGEHVSGFMRSLAIAIRFVINIPIDMHLLQQILSDPKKAATMLHEEGISHFTFNTQQTSVFPKPGTFVPTNHHCYLDNSFEEFYQGEYVAFEMYDPYLDAGESKDAKPVYIYAIILSEEKQEEDDISIFLRKYRVNLGPDQENAIVPVTQLYKFIRKSKQKSSKALIPYSGVGASSTELTSERTFPTDINIVLKEIRKMLMDAWELLSETGRKQVVKRLYLKWHPDKNIGNEAFCTKVLQELQRYIEILEQGKSLKVDDDDNDTDRFEASSFARRSHNSSRHRQSHGSFFNDAFYARMNTEGQRHKEDFESDTFTNQTGKNRSSHSNVFSKPNPQVGESRRWFKQAKIDLESARAAFKRPNFAHNWICFLCHQAVEKALKATIYYRNANSCMFRSHFLNPLASIAGDEQLIQLASQLERLVVNFERMRYPDPLVGMQVPSDVYSEKDAKEACTIAEQVLQQAGSLINISKDQF